MDSPILCECNSFQCSASPIQMSAEEQMEFRRTIPGVVFIAKDCPNGPEPTDILVEEKDKFFIYREG